MVKFSRLLLLFSAHFFSSKNNSSLSDSLSILLVFLLGVSFELEREKNDPVTLCVCEGKLLFAARSGK